MGGGAGGGGGQVSFTVDATLAILVSFRYLSAADEDHRQREQEGGGDDHVHRALRTPPL